MDLYIVVVLVISIRVFAIYIYATSAGVGCFSGKAARGVTFVDVVPCVRVAAHCDTSANTASGKPSSTGLKLLLSRLVEFCLPLKNAMYYRAEKSRTEERPQTCAAVVLYSGKAAGGGCRRARAVPAQPQSCS